MVVYNENMKKEISYYEQALALPNFKSYLLVYLAIKDQDLLESIALQFMEIAPEEGVRGANHMYCMARDKDLEVGA